MGVRVLVSGGKAQNLKRKQRSQKIKRPLKNRGDNGCKIGTSRLLNSPQIIPRKPILCYN